MIYEDLDDISKEIYNRISVWKDALSQSYTYLQVEKSLNKYDPDTKNYLSFSIANRPHCVHKKLTISQALIEASIINFWQVFSSGSGGNSISKNQGNPEIDKIRIQMTEQTIRKLNWTNEEYNEVYKLIRRKRNGLLAHYDGIVGDHKELSKGLYSRMSVGAHLPEKEREKFELIVKTMYEYVFNMLYLENDPKE